MHQLPSRQKSCCYTQTYTVLTNKRRRCISEIVKNQERIAAHHDPS